MPIDAPAMRKMRRIEPRDAPMVRRMAMSELLSFTSMMRPEMMLSAATSTISVRMMNMTLRSTFSASKNVLLRCRQSVITAGRSMARSSESRTASMWSGSSTKTSITEASPSLLKKSCAVVIGM